MQQKKDSAKRYKQQFIIGRHPLEEALENGVQIERIFIQKGVAGAEIDNIVYKAKNLNIAVSIVPIEKMNSFTKAVHQGVLAIAALIEYQDLQNVISHVVDTGEVPFFVMLDGITDVRNIGGIARSCHAMGVHAIIIPDKGVGSLNEDAVKTSAGALLQIPVCRVNSLLKAVDTLHLNGIMVYGAEMTAATTVSDLDKNEPCCIVMGSEDKGIFPPLLKACDCIFKVPMKRNFESLNVSVATGIILYEMGRGN
jgi:23S rRNA (guanosine2251-2'-O)-methyltransferase